MQSVYDAAGGTEGLRLLAAAGHSRVMADEVVSHAFSHGNGRHDELDERAIYCFDQAMHDVGLAATEPLWQVLHDYFAWATTTTMARYRESADEVPEGLTIPLWSWAGLQA